LCVRALPELTIDERLNLALDRAISALEDMLPDIDRIPKDVGEP